MQPSATVIAQFDQITARHPRKVAVFYGSERITYHQLAGHIHDYAGNLQHLQTIKPGDKVGILLKNSPRFIYALYALLKSGATVVPVNTFLKAPEVQHIVDDCGLNCLISEDDFNEVTGKLERVRIIHTRQLAHKSHTEPVWTPTTETDLAVIIYTSGTTGKSKGALLTHRNIATNVRSCITALDETTDDRLTLLLPMFHSFMLTVCIFMPLSMGAGIVLIKSVQPFKT